jgi:hypothetical protein
MCSGKKKQVSSQTFHAIWLLLGLAQVAVVSSGCGRGNAASSGIDDTLLSSESPTESNSPSQAGQAVPMPVRVSRSFFGGEVSGSIQLTDQAAPGSSGTTQVAAQWSEPQTTADHTGCVSLDAAGSPSLCFHLMDDVDSFGFVGQEMSATGIARYLEKTLGAPCAGEDWNVSRASAAKYPANATSRQVQSFTVSCQAKGGADCDRAPVRLDLTVQRSM